MALNLRVHGYEPIPGSRNVRLTGTTPYVRLSHGGDPPVYIQNGNVYGEEGPALDTLPEWFTGELAKLTPQARAEVGWGQQDCVSTPVAPEPVRSITPASSWTCSECGVAMPLRAKGLHIAKHRRLAR